MKKVGGLWLIVSSMAWGGWHQNAAQMETALEWGASERPPARSSVAVIQQYKGVELAGSGAIIDPSWVVTAAHVSDNNIQKGYHPCVTSVPDIFDEDIVSALQRVMSSKETRPDTRSIIQVVSFGATYGDPDVAFLKVSEPFPDAWVTPMISPDFFKKLKSDLQAAKRRAGIFSGFGNGFNLETWRPKHPSFEDFKAIHQGEHGEEWRTENNHFGRRAVYPCALTSFFIKDGKNIARSQFNCEGGTGIAPDPSALMFDSGGPLFVEEKGQYGLAGVVGRSAGHAAGQRQLSMTSFMPLYLNLGGDEPLSMLEKVLEVQSEKFRVRLVS